MTMRKVCVFVLIVLSVLCGCVSREEVDGLKVDDIVEYRQHVVGQGPACKFVLVSNRPDIRVAHYSCCVAADAAEEQKAARFLLKAIVDCRDICENAFEGAKQDECFAQCLPE